MGDAYDVAVIGAGTGGYSTALRAAELGLRVVLVERDDRIGGTCLIRGCIPTKALLQSAAVMDTVDRASEWGIKAAGEPDWSAIKAFEDAIVDKLVKGVTGLIVLRKIDVVTGTARLVTGPAVEVDGRRIEANHVVIATGSRPELLPGLAADGPDHHERPGPLLRPDPLLGRRDRRRRGGARVRLPVPVVRRRRHPARGAAPPGPARGRGGLQGDRPRVPQTRHHHGGRRLGHVRDPRGGRGRGCV